MAAQCDPCFGGVVVDGRIVFVRIHVGQIFVWALCSVAREVHVTHKA